MVLLILGVVGLIYIFYLYVTNKYTYWTKKGVKGPPPTPIVGHFGKVMLQKESANSCLKDIYDSYPEEKVVGIYRGLQPALLLRDPEIIKHVLIKDFPIFQDRGMKNTKSKLRNNLFETDGHTWKILRQKLTPVFTSKKLRDMVPLIEESVNEYMVYVEKLIENNVDHEIRALKAKYTLRVIGSCAFGLNLDTFSEEENEFSLMAKKLFTPTPFVRFLTILNIIIPGVRTLFDTASEIQQFFIDLVSKIVKQREHEPMKRKDFMDLMIELRDQGKITRKGEEGMTELEMDDVLIAAQAIVFYAAGFETSSATMSFLIHELALHQDVQNKVYKEICQVSEKYNNKINYDAIKEMTYLEMVFDEALRKHTVAGVLNRKAQANYTLPEVNITIPKGTHVFISLSGMHLDEKYYPNPKEFNPEHFSEENKNTRAQCTYLPFGDGPRNCIGMRFAMVQSLMVLAVFLKKFKVEPSAKTKREIEYDPTTITLESKGGIWVKISKR